MVAERQNFPASGDFRKTFPRSLGTMQGHSILITSDSAKCQDAAEVHGVAP
jgi:hypothetical protein